MAKRSRIKINSSLARKMEMLDQDIEDEVKVNLMNIANTAVNLSPVDTGSYVNSFSFSVGPGRPRGKSSRNKPKNQDILTQRESGLQNLVNDISRITDFSTKDSIVLRNSSPHARVVENGGANWRHQGYRVFTQIRDIYG